MDFKKISKTEFATLLDITPQSVNKLINGGKLDNCINEEGKILLEKAIWTLDNNLLSSKGKVFEAVKRLIKEYPNPKAIKKETKREINYYEELEEAIQDPEKAKDLLIKEKFFNKMIKEIDAEHKKLKLLQDKGLLVKKEDVEKEIFSIFRLLRDSITNIPNRLSADLSVETSQKQIEKMLKKEIDSTLDDIADKIDSNKDSMF